jgi:hypothetical protein
MVDNPIRYGDLWTLLRKLGFDCNAHDEQNHRVCEFAPTDTRIVLHDYPANEPVREEILVGVRLQLDNGGVLSRAEFDRWVVRRANVNTAAGTNGSQPRRKSRKHLAPPG